MKKIIKRDIYESSKFLFVCLKIVGLAPYKLNTKAQKLTTTLSNYVEFAIAITAWAFLTWVQIRSSCCDYFDSGVKSKLLDKLWLYQYLLQHLFACLVIIFNFRERKTIETCLKTVHDFDNELERLNWKFSPAEVSSFPVLALFIFTGLIITTEMFAAQYLAKVNGDRAEIFNLNSILPPIANVAVTTFYLILSAQFIYFTFIVYVRLNVLKKNFK